MSQNHTRTKSKHGFDGIDWVKGDTVQILTDNGWKDGVITRKQDKSTLGRLWLTVEYWDGKNTTAHLPSYSDQIRLVSQHQQTPSISYGTHDLIQFVEPIRVTCNWHLCGKSQRRHPKSQFKMCGNCKMVYYCCRKCQKKSWNMKHKHQCNILKFQYAHCRSFS
eukprot:243783_1